MFDYAWYRNQMRRCTARALNPQSIKQTVRAEGSIKMVNGACQFQILGMSWMLGVFLTFYQILIE